MTQPLPLEDDTDPLSERVEQGGREVAAVRGSWLAAFPGGRAPLLSDLTALPGAALLRDERARRIWKVPLADGRAAIVKVYLTNFFTALPYLFARPMGEREFQGLRLFERAGAPTAAPIGWARERRWGILRASAVVVQAIAGAVDVLAVANDMGPRARDPGDPERSALLAALALSFRAIHERGVTCGEKGAHLRNVLVERAPEGAPPAAPRLRFIDLPNAHRVEGARLERERVDDLGRLMVRLAERFGDEGRARFLDAYLGPGTPPERRLALEAAIEGARRTHADETWGALLRRRIRRSFRWVFGLRGRRGAGEVRA